VARIIASTSGSASASSGYPTQRRFSRNSERASARAGEHVFVRPGG
jgi:hypothetical protein